MTPSGNGNLKVRWLLGLALGALSFVVVRYVVRLEEALQEATRQDNVQLVNQSVLLVDVAAIKKTLDKWEHAAPAPAESTRTALRGLDGRLLDMEINMQELRRVLRIPR